MGRNPLHIFTSDRACRSSAVFCSTNPSPHSPSWTLKECINHHRLSFDWDFSFFLVVRLLDKVNETRIPNAMPISRVSPSKTAFGMVIVTNRNLVSTGCVF
jgi:hypothetical protein